MDSAAAREAAATTTVAPKSAAAAAPKSAAAAAPATAEAETEDAELDAILGGNREGPARTSPTFAVCAIESSSAKTRHTRRRRGRCKKGI